MPDLFKEVTHLYNLRNSLICGSYKIKTVRYGAGTITYLGPKIWPIIPNEIRESASLEAFRQKIKLWKPNSCPCCICKNTLQTLASLIIVAISLIVIGLINCINYYCLL